MAAIIKEESTLIEEVVHSCFSKRVGFARSIHLLRICIEVNLIRNEIRIGRSYSFACQIRAGGMQILIAIIG